MIFPDFSYEEALLEKGFSRIVGCDEVGVGCLAGSVIAAAVSIPSDVVSQLEGKVKDSKKLSAKKRFELCELITSSCECGIGEAAHTEIDSLGILPAVKLATVRAVNSVADVEYVLVDGGTSFSSMFDIPCKNIIKGDNKSMSIACASIIAKAYRDDQMNWADRLYPGYYFYKHKGYGTKQHKDSLVLLGPCEIHRKTFRGVLQDG